MSSAAVYVPRGPERIAIAERVVVSDDSIVRVYHGRGSANMRERIRRAAIELGITPPPEVTHA